MNTLSTIKELAATQFGGEPDAIDENAPVDQLGIDSLGFLEFLFELEDKLGECKVMLAIIGPQWADARDENTGSRRLDNPDDWVRLEI